jgi:hypothetical protein
LPEHPFFYTLDQIQNLLSVSQDWLRRRTFYLGRSPNAKRLDDLEAINLSAANEPPTWRVSERELLRWLARHHYKIEVIEQPHRRRRT